MKKKTLVINEEKENKNNRYRRITIPYMSGLSEEFSREMKMFEIPVSFKAYETIVRHSGHPKDPVSKVEQSGVINRIMCKECDGEYIGEAGRPRNARLYERTQRSALVEHSVTIGHEIDWEGVAIIETEENWQ